jgi:acetolactate synthase small subunit
MNNETLIDTMVEAIAAAVLAKIGKSTINEELYMLRDEMTRVHNRIAALTNKIDTADRTIADCIIDITSLETKLDDMGETVTRDDVVDIVRDTLSGASLSIDI